LEHDLTDAGATPLTTEGVLIHQLIIIFSLVHMACLMLNREIKHELIIKLIA
jgi:hypothetical protein